MEPAMTTTRWMIMAVLAITALPIATSRAEIGEVRVAQQFGLTYLPLIVARNQKMIEKRAAAAGLPTLKVTWVRLGGGSAMNDALLTGSIEFASAGLGPLLTIWDKTRNNLGVRGVAALDASAVLLNVNRPDLKTLADLRDDDRIGLPAVKVSHQAVLLQMAAAQAFGPSQYDRLDRLTVTLAHPDAFTALLSGKTEITGHFGNSPFIYQELDDPRVHRLLSSEDTLGGLGTITSVFTSAKVRSDNPTVYRAVFDAVVDAQALIQQSPDLAARIYAEEEQGKLDAEAIRKLLALPSSRYSIAPLNTQKFADFMFQTGALKNRPDSWRDYYFPEVHELQGS